jgi:hypothetical protein
MRAVDDVRRTSWTSREPRRERSAPAGGAGAPSVDMRLTPRERRTERTPSDLVDSLARSMALWGHAGLSESAPPAPF